MNETADEKERRDLRVRELYLKALEDYEGAEPNWRLQRTFQLILGGLHSLRHYIEEPTDPNISWADPFVELQYDVDWDWGLWEGQRRIGGRTLCGDIGLEDFAAKTTQDKAALAKKLAGNFLQHLDFILLRCHTLGAAYIKRENNYEPIINVWTQSELDKLPESEAQARLEDLLTPFTISGYPLKINEDAVREALQEEILDTPDLTEKAFEEQCRACLSWKRKSFDVPALRLKGIVDGSPFSGSVVLQIHPLVVDEGERRAYFPVVVGLVFEGEDIDPASWSTNDRRSFWENLLGELDAVRGGLRELGRKQRPNHLNCPLQWWSRRTFPLAFGRALGDENVLDFVRHVHRVRLPRKWSTIPRWEQLKDEEVRRILEEEGESAFENHRETTGDPDAERLSSTADTGTVQGQRS